VAPGETATSLTVTATSTVDADKSGTVTVTLPGYTDMLSATTSTVTITGNSAYNSTIFTNGRTVTLSPFSIAKYETTYELWYTVRQWATSDDRGPKKYTFNPGREGHDGISEMAPTEAAKYEPVTSVDWRDAVVWCNAYSEMSGKDPVYLNGSDEVLRNSNDAASADPTKWAGKDGYRLPTEAEWEYAARGGGTPSTSGYFVYTYAGSNTIGNVAWYTSNSSNATHPVGENDENELGLYDMSGNVSEWCWDWDSAVGTGIEPDPTGPGSGSYKEVRGGGRDSGSNMCTVAARRGTYIYAQAIDMGFRVVARP
jgi:formylglycine-generating enzyme required for sulfatase activity